MDQFEQSALEAIFRRRSVRAYQDRTVERDKIVKLLQAGMAAPSACNLQIWEFVVVTEKPLIDRLRDFTNLAKYNAPMAVVLCANTENVPWQGDDWKIDLSAAAENMMIAAASMGLGSVWSGSNNLDAIRTLLDIPERIHIMNVVYFGYPAEQKKPGTKYDETAVYWQKYDLGRVRKLRTIDMLRDPKTLE